MKKRGCLRIVALAAGGLFLLCIVAAGIAALSNRYLPPGPERLDLLDPLDKARLAETLHLKAALGEAAWPGFGQADIPVLLWNREYSFLVGFAEAPAGWETVAGDTVAGQPYHRQSTHDPQNFGLQIQGRWVGSMATKHETDLFFREQFQKSLPPGLRQVFPYRLLIFPSEVQIAAVLHESFHAYQALVNPTFFAQADSVYGRVEHYWAVDVSMHQDWTEEIDLLIEAVQAEDDSQAAELAGRFLEQRAARRAGLAPDLVDYERKIEWLEGLAKYAELESWRLAAETTGYEPLPAMSADPDFYGYRNLSQRSSQELAQMRRQATRPGDTRFYYTGMAQAYVLDRLMPAWKERALHEGVYLEDLLQEALARH